MHRYLLACPISSPSKAAAFASRSLVNSPNCAPAAPAVLTYTQDCMAVDALWGGCLRGGHCTLSGLAIWFRDVGFEGFGGAGVGCQVGWKGRRRSRPPGLVRPLVAVFLSVM